MSISSSIIFSACKHRSTPDHGDISKYSILFISDLVTLTTDLVSTWCPGCCGNRHLGIMAEWSLVSHGRLGSPLGLSWCTGRKTLEISVSYLELVS